MQKEPKFYFISSKVVFIAFLLTITSICLVVFMAGLNSHRSLFVNTLISLTLLSICFFLFVSIGLYKGFRLQESFGSVDKHIRMRGSVDSSIGDVSEGTNSFDLPEVDGLEGVLFAIFYWILITGLLVLLTFFFETILVGSFWILIGALYWVFYRAVRLVLKNRKVCKGDLGKSLLMALLYTALYVGWLYMIVGLLHYLA